MKKYVTLFLGFLFLTATLIVTLIKPLSVKAAECPNFVQFGGDYAHINEDVIAFYQPIPSGNINNYQAIFRPSPQSPYELISDLRFQGGQIPRTGGPSTPSYWYATIPGSYISSPSFTVYVKHKGDGTICSGNTIEVQGQQPLLQVSLLKPLTYLEFPRNEMPTTMPEIAIDFGPNFGTHLPPGTKFRIKMSGAWDTSDCEWIDRVNDCRDEDVKWAVMSGGNVISAVSLCENGQAYRNDCQEAFPGGGGLDPGPSATYNLTIYNETGTQQISNIVSFTMRAIDPSSTSNFVAGENPCNEDLDGDGIIDCPTALGNIPTDITGFAQKFLSIAIGLAGGIALILLVFGSIRVLVSAGNQQALAGGRDMIIAAVAGLLFLIFSVLILRALGLVIGVTFP